MFLNFKLKKKKVLLFFINIFIFAAVILLISPLVSCGDSGKVDDMKAAAGGKKLIVGSDVTNKPFEFKEDGNVEGFDIDIAREIAKRMDKEIEIVPITWDSTYKIPEDLKFKL